MFSSKSQLQRRTPVNGTNRENYLSLLVDEYLHSSSYDSKCQVLANLSNFSYDPINYGYIRDVGVLDIFLHVLKTDSDENLLRFAIAGICNLCIDDENAQYILENSELKYITALLKSKNTDIVIDSITILLYLHNNQTELEINRDDVKQQLINLKKSPDKRINNLVSIFLQDVYKSNSV